MNQAANQRALRVAVERLARTDVDANDVSRAIDAFGQVLADLTDTPLRLAVISGEAFEENNELRAKVQRLKKLLNESYGVSVDTHGTLTFAGFKIVEDPSLKPNEIKAVCVNHQFLNGTCRYCGLVHWSE